MEYSPLVALDLKRLDTPILDYSDGTLSQLCDIAQVPSENTTSLNNGTVQPNKVPKGLLESHKLLYSYFVPPHNVTSKQPCPLVPYGLGLFVFLIFIKKNNKKK